VRVVTLVKSVHKRPKWMRKHKVSLLGKYHNALVLAKEIRKDEKRLHSIQKAMKHKYSEDLIDHLNAEKEEAIESHPDRTERYAEEYDKKLQKIAKGFLHDTEELTKSYIEVFDALDKMVEFDDRSESDDLIAIGDVIQKATSYQDQMLFTDDNIARFKKTFEHLERQLAHDMKQDYRNDKRESHGDDPKHLGLRIHKSDKHLAKALRKADKKFAGNEQQWKAIGDRMKDQLERHAVKPDFLDIFEGYIDEFAIMERAMRIIREDVRALVIHHVHEHNKESARWTIFCRQIESVFSEIHIPDSYKKTLDEFYGDDEHNQVGQKAVDFANREGRDERAMYGELQQDDKYYHRFLEKIEHDKRALHKETERIASS